jgi:hypothetical protein
MITMTVFEYSIVYLGSIDSDKHVVKLHDLLSGGFSLLASELEVFGHFKCLKGLDNCNLRISTCSMLIPLLISIGMVKIRSGVFSATSSMSIPPSGDPTMTGPLNSRSIRTAR